MSSFESHAFKSNGTDSGCTDHQAGFRSPLEAAPQKMQARNELDKALTGKSNPVTERSALERTVLRPLDKGYASFAQLDERNNTGAISFKGGLASEGQGDKHINLADNCPMADAQKKETSFLSEQAKKRALAAGDMAIAV